jgi:hypothetical protein
MKVNVKKLILILIIFLIAIVNLILNTYLYKFNLQSLQKYIDDLYYMSEFNRFIVVYTISILSLILFTVSFLVSYSDRVIYWYSSRLRTANILVLFIKTIQDEQLRKKLLEEFRVRMLIVMMLIGIFLLCSNLIYSLVDTLFISDALKVILAFSSGIILIAYSIYSAITEYKILIDLQSKIK